MKSAKQDFPVITRGDGVYLFDRDGRRYFDATAGLFVASCGHGNREIAAEIAERSKPIGFVNSAYFTTEISEELGSRLAAIDPALGLTRSLFLCSGSEAVEAAVKLARQIHVERGEVRRHKIISRFPSYHGNTLFALAVSGRPAAKQVFEPLLHPVTHIPSPYRYHSEVEDFDGKGAAHYAAYLERAIVEAGPDTVAAFVVEPVSASAAAGDKPPKGYFDEIQKICAKYGVLIIADEVLCGTGRTGKFFASSHFGLKPDILTMGKGISGGYVPLSVVLTREEHYRTIAVKSGSLVHFQTYQQAPCMAAAGVAVLNYYERHQVVKNSLERGEQLKRELQAAFRDHPRVGNIPGTGLLLAIELVQDRAAKKCFPRAEKTAEKLADSALGLGLSFHPYAAHAPGGNGDFLMISPPLTISAGEVTELVSLFRKSLEALA
ncbi:MAG: aminotransferase class III-fold pyridoxal phosphate-dependent enzyme [Bdellovibrionia bacterium]